LDDWINANGTERAYQRFIDATKERLKLSAATSPDSNANFWNLPKALQLLLAERLSLVVEGITDALHHSGVFEEWWSSDNIDLQFGAKLDWKKQECAGRNIFVNPESSDSEANQKILCDFIVKARDELKLLAPTRFLFVVPRPTGSAGTAYAMAIKAKFLEIARFQNLECIPHDSFRSVQPAIKHTGIEVSLFLGINKESLARDPISWTLLCDELRKWAPGKWEVGYT
jgi:hypothetical protein